MFKHILALLLNVCFSVEAEDEEEKGNEGRAEIITTGTNQPMMDR